MKNHGPSKPSTDRGKGHALGPKRHKEKHLGGKGLSLGAFANAKTKTSYDPSQIRKQREYYKNAKNVNKYRKLVKRLGEEGHMNKLQIDGSTLELGQEGTAAKEEKKTTIEHGHCQSDLNDNEHVPPTFNRRVNEKSTSGSYRKKKNKNTLQKLREEYEKKKQEEEQLRKEKEAALAAKRTAREKAESKRKDMKSKMYKKTRSGQPVMKYRLEHLLERIQKSV